MINYTFLKRVIVAVLGMIIVVQLLDLFVFDFGISNSLVYVFMLVVAFEVGLFISDRFLA